MPNPSISPAATGATTYAISNSNRAITDLVLEIVVGTPEEFTVTYPTTIAGGTQVELLKGMTSLDLLPGPLVGNTSFAGRQVDASTTPSGASTVLSCSISVTAGAALTEPWTVRTSGLGGNTCQFTLNANNAGSNITRVMCDPVAGFSVSAPTLSGTTAKEKDTITVSATLATGTAAAPTVVGTPMPSVNYKWTYSGDIAITAFPLCGGQIQNFVAPGVYGAKTINVTEQVWFDGSCTPEVVGFLNNATAAQPLTIQPRTQYLMLVLDRSGSMWGSKWENAKTAARILTHLFVALRSGVAGTDQIGIIVFEDGMGTWHNLSIDPLIGPGLVLNSIGQADVAICGTDFGPAGSWTPIGDGLWEAMRLINLMAATDEPKYTIILLTDGYENSGTIRIDPNTPAPSFVRNFSTARNDFPNINSRLTLYTAGLGSTVQEDVLDALPLPAGTGPSGIYRNVTDVSELKQAIAQMVSFSQEAQSIVPLAGAPPQTDPSPLAQQRYFQVETRVNRMALAIEWTNPADTIELAWRNQASAGPFAPISPAVKQCPTHGFVSVDLAVQFDGEANVPATEWRVVHRSGGAPQPIADDNLLIFVDLYVKADIAFDQTQYRTGDPMIVTARLRAGDEPVIDASISVELARPGEALGTFLAVNARQYRPAPPGGPDPAHPKQAMLQQLLREREMEGLPITRPPQIFADGTNELFDDGTHEDGASGDGNFANVFTITDKEGTYTWRFYIEGQLPDGSPFNRLMTISKWVGVNVEPLDSAVTMTFGVLPAPRDFQAAQVFVTPVDKYGGFLGPFRTSDLAFSTSTGRFLTDADLGSVADGVVLPQQDGAATISHYDGRYSRVVAYRRGQVPIVNVSIQGKPMVPVVVAPGCLGQIAQFVRAVLQWLMRLIRR